MEQDNLEQLSAFLQEEIFLLPEDKELVKKGLGNTLTYYSSEPKTSTTSYPQSETQAPITQEMPEVIEPTPIQVRGNYSKGILVLHEESELGPEVMDMLVKMINACGHSMNEIGLLPSEALEGRTMEDFQFLNAHVVLKFGRIKHPINAVPAQYYEPYSDEETEFLFADALSAIAEDKALKKKLWTALQQLFNLKN